MFLKRRFHLVLFVYGICVSRSLCALEQGSQFWGTLAAKTPFTSGTHLSFEAQARIGRGNADLFQGGPGFIIDINKQLRIAVGASLWTSKTPSVELIETRAWQALKFIHDVRTYQLSHRLLLEERFFNNLGNNYRLRYRFNWKYPYKRIFVQASEELILSFNDLGVIPGGFEQNRVIGTFGIRLSRHFTFEFGYMNQYIKRLNVDDIMVHVLLAQLSIS